MFRNKLVVSAEVYHCHPDDLTPEQQVHLLDYLALYEVEQAKRQKG